MCGVLRPSSCIHVCHHVHTFVFAGHLPVPDSVPVRALCQNKRLRPGKSDMWTICLWGPQAGVCVCESKMAVVFLMSVCVCVCVFKTRRCLSPGPNLQLYRGEIRFLSPPLICVSAAMTVIETLGTVCVCEHWELVCVCLCTCVRVMTGDRKFCQQQTASRQGQTLFPFST